MNSPAIRQSIRSLSPKDIAQRARYLQDENFADRCILNKKKSRNNQKIKNIRINRKGTIVNRFLEQRVRHHLSNGRDLADIVVRENALASTITKIIEKIQSNNQ